MKGFTLYITLIIVDNKKKSKVYLLKDILEAVFHIKIDRHKDRQAIFLSGAQAAMAYTHTANSGPK